MRKLLVLASLMVSGYSFASINFSISKVNPASVAGTITKNCKSFYSDFLSSFEKQSSDLPYVKNSKLISETKWTETAKTATQATRKKDLYFSVNTTVVREYPLSLVRLKVTHTYCLPPKFEMTTKTNCLEKYQFNIDGSESVIYQTAVDFARYKNHFSSFSYGVNLAETADKAKCNISTKFTIKNSDYLWAKKELLGSIEPKLVEKAIIGNFIAWSKNLIEKLEVL